ncbi:hypothetical protein AQUCO_07400043v1 [Aquilegia coerulea]|uniref:C2H2-type domain-containing protein n=1 Tax=Aquilegia coerulea TaxID=218851 RepID=A0A2G5C9I9_AQUCA|nr:hypothetical protein AQUCO_07400043v1 [Aquilegia coerulea]
MTAKKGSSAKKTNTPRKSPTGSPSSSDKLPFIRAVLRTATNNGNHKKALKDIKDHRKKNRDSGALHYAKALILEDLCLKRIKDNPDLDKEPNVNLEEEIKNDRRRSIRCAEEATKMNPNSMEFALCLAHTLYVSAHEPKDYQLVKKACEQGLAIQDPEVPVDPFLLFGEDKIVFLRNELERLMYSCKKEDILAYYFKYSEPAFLVLNEALVFGNENGQWDHWMCCSCSMKFTESELHYKHAEDEHEFGRLTPEQESVMPSRLSNHWCEMICEGKWMPRNFLEIQTAIKSVVLAAYKSNHEEERALVSKLGELSDVEDSERESLLERIRVLFENMLMNENCLAKEHVDMVLDYIRKKLKDEIAEPWLSLLGLTRICFSFLGASELKEILKFLEEISQFYKENIAEHEIILAEIPDPEGETLRSPSNQFEGIAYADDSLRLVFPESPQVAEIVTKEFAVEQVDLWIKKREDRGIYGHELYKIFKKLEPMCDQKYGVACHMEALRGLWDSYLKVHNQENDCTIKHIPLTIETLVDAMTVATKIIREQAKSIDITEAQALINATGVCATVHGSNMPLHPNTNTKLVICKLSANVALELMKIDTLIIRIAETLKCEFNDFAKDDYSVVLHPLVKSYIQYLHTQAEDAAEKTSGSTETDHDQGVANGTDNVEDKSTEKSGLETDAFTTETDHDQGVADGTYNVDNKSTEKLELKTDASDAEKPHDQGVADGTDNVDNKSTEKLELKTDASDAEKPHEQVVSDDTGNVNNLGTLGGDDLKQTEEDLRPNNDANKKLLKELGDKYDFLVKDVLEDPDIGTGRESSDDEVLKEITRLQEALPAIPDFEQLEEINASAERIPKDKEVILQAIQGLTKSANVSDHMFDKLKQSRKKVVIFQMDQKHREAELAVGRVHSLLNLHAEVSVLVNEAKENTGWKVV